MVAETLDTDLGVFTYEVYHKGHENFYENQRGEETLTDMLDEAEQALPTLDTHRQSPPRPFTINSNTQLRRLRAPTNNNELRIGDTSPVGFSLRHTLREGEKAIYNDDTSE